MSKKQAVVTVDGDFNKAAKQICQELKSILGKVKCWVVLANGKILAAYSTPVPKRHTGIESYMLYNRGEFGGAFSPLVDMTDSVFTTFTKTLWDSVA